MIGAKVAESASRMALVQLLVKALDAIALLVVARFLTPTDFGLVALAVSILLVANALTRLPVIDVLVQKPKLEEQLVHTAFTLTALRGLSISIVLMLLAAPLSIWLDDARLLGIVCLIALSPLFEGLSSPNMVWFLRKVNYGPVAMTQMSGRIVSFIVILVIAVYSKTYWALVIGMVIAPFVTTFTTYILAPYRPRLRLNGMLDILPFAGWVTLSQVILTLNQQADRFFVGSVLGKASLGQYAMAGDIASMASWTIATPVMQPLFSGFSRMKNDMPRLTKAYLKGQQIMITIVAPLGFGLAAVADSLIPLAIGPQWQPSVALIWWLGPTIALQMMTVPVHSMTMALAKPKLLVLRELFALLVRLPITLLAAFWFGLLWAVIARCVTSFFIVGLNLSIATRLLNVTVIQQLVNCMRAVLSAFVMVAGITIFQYSVQGSASTLIAFLHLVSAIVIGGFIYTLSLLYLWRLAGCPDSAESWILGRIQLQFVKIRNRLVSHYKGTRA